jgi:N-acyl-L-homoserine lactone synthetase
MIRVIDKTNFHLFPRTMDQLFRVRHSVFVEEKGWIQFERDGIYEKDQYDTEDAAYVVALDNLGTLSAVSGSIRRSCLTCSASNFRIWF